MGEIEAINSEIRVLHSVGCFLNISENWIFPQIFGVPEVKARVFCEATANLDAFAVPSCSLIVARPAWNRAGGIPRGLTVLGRWFKCEGLLTNFRLRRWRPHILHAHFGDRAFSNLNLKSRLGVRLITSFYGWDAWLLPESNPSWVKKYQELFKVGDIFLVEGSAMRDRLISLGCPAEKIKIHRIGADLSILKFAEKDFSQGLKIAMVGRFTEKKGLVDGLRACALAQAQGVDLEVTIVGDASANDPAGQEIKRHLQALAGRPELTGHVRFAGFLSLAETRTLLAGQNVMLCPSRRAAGGDAEGGSPVVLTEAMAMGLVCLGTRHCDIPEVILDGQTGWLCEEGEVNKLAELISRLARNHEEILPMTRQGRQHVEENFSLQSQLQKLGRIYCLQAGQASL